VIRRILNHGLWRGLLATLLLLAINGAMLLWSEPRHASEAVVRLAGFDAHPEGVIESATEKDTSSIIFKMVEDFANSFTANAVVERACAKLDVPMEMREDIRARVRTAPIVGSTFVRVTARHKDPEMARRIVAAFLEARAELHQQRVEKGLAEQKAQNDVIATSIEQKLRQITDELSSARQSVDYAANITVIEKSLAGIIVERARLQSTIASLEAMSKAGLLGDLKEEPGAEAFFQETETLRKWGVIELRRNLAASRSELAETLASSGENSPRTIVARARVAALEQELKSFLSTQIEKEKTSLAALDRSVKELTEKKAAYDAAMQEDRRRELAEGPKRAIKAGLEASLTETVKARQLIDLQKTSLVTLFVIEDPPSLPAAAERPVPTVALLSCPVIGLLIGLLGTGRRKNAA
jgi:capsule polysaccharide export protein KpsE/RkpR